MKKVGTVALVIKYKGESPHLIEALSDDQEINLLEQEISNGGPNPLKSVYQHRDKVAKEDEEFGDYVEELLCQPFLKPEIQDQGVQWLRSKIKIEQYQQSEREATEVIAKYAYKIFQEDPKKMDFLLASHQAKVRIRVFQISAKEETGEQAA